MNERICGICNEIIKYSSKYKKERADKAKSVCRKCSNKKRKGADHPMYGKTSGFKNKKHTEYSKGLISKNHIDVSGENNPMYNSNGGMFGKIHTKETKKKISEGNKDKIISDETKKKIKTSLKEYYKLNDSPTKGKKHTNETKCKMRLSAIKRIERCKFNNMQFYPSYNKKSIKEIIDYAEINNLKLKHAENGGEFFIKELGYWVDGYDFSKNVVVEFYETHHKYRENKDINRRNEIINFLKCEFIVIHEDGNIEKYE